MYIFSYWTGNGSEVTKQSNRFFARNEGTRTSQTEGGKNGGNGGATRRCVPHFGLKVAASAQCLCSECIQGTEKHN